MYDPCEIFTNLGRIANCRLPVEIEWHDYLTMDTSMHAMALITVVLAVVIWKVRRWRRGRTGRSAEGEPG